MQITIEVPDQYLEEEEQPGELAQRMKLSTALLMFKEEEISAGAACELAGVDRYTFLAACKKHGSPVVRYDEGELEEELQRLSDFPG